MTCEARSHAAVWFLLSSDPLAYIYAFLPNSVNNYQLFVCSGQDPVERAYISKPSSVYLALLPLRSTRGS